ncbi:MAG: EamA family transporter [Flammeovirgaceae bacterium]|nr:EamA family transporter [Flammeovirgaceae bacterium]
MNNRSLIIAYLALAAVCLIWGTTYLALRIAVTHFPPFLFSGIRQVAAGLILLIFMLTLGKQKLPSRHAMLQQAFGGFLMMTLGNGFVAWGEMYIPSGIAAIICSLMPIWVILINLTVNKDERPTVPIIIGVALGMLGIIMIFGEHLSDFSNTQYLMGIAMTFLATISWASGSVWIKKRNLQSNPFMNAGLQMFFGGLFMLPCSLLVDDLTNIQWTSEAVYSMLYLIVFGSLAAYTCYSYALRKLPMTIVSMYAYINPLVAVVLGWMVLDEKLNIRIISAILITVAGIYIVNKGYQLRDLWRAQFSEGR